MLNLIIISAVFLQGLIALSVLQRRRDSFSNISFVFLSFASMSWAIANFAYTLDPVSENAFFIIRLIMFFVVIQNTAFYIFSSNYPSHSLAINKKHLSFILPLSVIVAIATLLPLVFSSVSVGK